MFDNAIRFDPVKRCCPLQSAHAVPGDVCHSKTQRMRDGIGCGAFALAFPETKTKQRNDALDIQPQVERGHVLFGNDV